MKALFLLVGAFLLPAVAPGAVNLGKIPSAFCEPAETLLFGARSCTDNQRLSGGAERCYEKLEALERRLGVDAMAIAASGQRSQLSRVTTGAREYDFSDQALSYLIATAELALKEIEPFPAYLLAPEGYYEPKVTGGLDPEEYAKRLDCHGGNERRIASVQEKLTKKIARFCVRQREARAHQKSLNGSAVDLGSLTAGAAARGAVRKVASKPRKRTAAGASSITGVEADRAKRRKAP